MKSKSNSSSIDGENSWTRHSGSSCMCLDQYSMQPKTIAQADQDAGISFDGVDILNIASIDFKNATGTWYPQATTGTIARPANLQNCEPANLRTAFRVVVVSAPDNSSHNVLSVQRERQGGRALCDDVYVLSVPAFEWVGITDGNSPRYSHLCHLVGRSQNGDYWWRKLREPYGMVRLGEQGSRAVRYEQTTRLGLGKRLQRELRRDTKFQRRSTVLSVASDSQGNATMSAPTDGFGSPDIGSFFNQHRKDDHQLSGGGIAGAVIGSIAGVALLVAGVLFFWRRKKRRRAQAETKAEPERQQAIAQADSFPIHEAPSTVEHRPSFRSLFRKKVELPVPVAETAVEMEAPVHELDGNMTAVELDIGEKSAALPEADHNQKEMV
ncbi:hypothetical protein N7468_010393 [Penicillium chermesinum]|uniref:Uncharacterized protein n=1 Tax=Penicillium chermesinum TaxID=63820 RepID=A0A9W9TDB2_9EURO|nr:uncharacterized protein N7468_010393 [Penicillium chermesinum]KAJ5217385.1 hypothetical protein N7468_010393 [Penicillium chermesinum]